MKYCALVVVQIVTCVGLAFAKPLTTRRAVTLTEKAAMASPEPTRDAPVRATKARLLLVDDNEDSAVLLGELLQSVGYEVDVAHDGGRALAMIETFEPDIAFLDIGLPDMTGYELASKLREKRPHVRVMAMSGYGEHQDGRADARFETHFVKPVTLAKLVLAIERVTRV